MPFGYRLQLQRREIRTVPLKLRPIELVFSDVVVNDRMVMRTYNNKIVNSIQVNNVVFRL
jgi:hypothetical protein